jgi:hypothetical protein
MVSEESSFSEIVTNEELYTRFPEIIPAEEDNPIHRYGSSDDIERVLDTLDSKRYWAFIGRQVRSKQLN